MGYRQHAERRKSLGFKIFTTKQKSQSAIVTMSDFFDGWAMRLLLSLTNWMQKAARAISTFARLVVVAAGLMVLFAIALLVVAADALLYREKLKP